jgi:hypothetical protein
MPALSPRARNLFAGAVIALQAGVGLTLLALPHPKANIGPLFLFMAAFSFIGAFGLSTLTRRAAVGVEAGLRTESARWLILGMTSFSCIFFMVAAYGGPKVQGPAALMFFVSGLKVLNGAWNGKLGPNPLLGVRTPWTYASRLAWDKSNRLTGRLWFWGGLIGLAATPFAPQPAGLNLVLAAVVASWGAGAFESWWVWRSDPDRRASF